MFTSDRPDLGSAGIPAELFGCRIRFGFGSVMGAEPKIRFLFLRLFFTVFKNIFHPNFSNLCLQLISYLKKILPAALLHLFL